MYSRATLTVILLVFVLPAVLAASGFHFYEEEKEAIAAWSRARSTYEEAVWKLAHCVTVVRENGGPIRFGFSDKMVEGYLEPFSPIRLEIGGGKYDVLLVDVGGDEAAVELYSNNLTGRLALMNFIIFAPIGQKNCTSATAELAADAIYGAMETMFISGELADRARDLKLAAWIGAATSAVIGLATAILARRGASILVRIRLE